MDVAVVTDEGDMRDYLQALRFRFGSGHDPPWLCKIRGRIGAPVLGRREAINEEPFMEHPSGEYASAVDAMEAAIIRLRALPEWNRWITFCAQGEGERAETLHIAEVRLMSDVLDLGIALDIAQVVSLAKVPRRALASAGETLYSVAAATPREVAQILDALFRHQLEIRPFADAGGDDYAVGAEW